jgi:hypothetical protein
MQRFELWKMENGGRKAPVFDGFSKTSEQRVKLQVDEVQEVTTVCSVRDGCEKGCVLQALNCAKHNEANVLCRINRFIEVFLKVLVGETK